MTSGVVETRASALADLAEADRDLAQTAQAAARNAYAPYSGFAVGAAVRTRSGKLYTGANQENASYGVTMCAEVSALTAASSAGDFDVEAIAVVGHKFIEPLGDDLVVTPCGRCRQLICEAAQISQIDVRVISCSGDLSRVLDAPISELLPHAFGPENLGLDKKWPLMRTKLHGVMDGLIRGRAKAR